MKDIAIDLIEKAQKESWKRLNLSRCGLTENNIPSQLWELTSLEELVLCNRYWNHEKQEWIKSPNAGPLNVFPGFTAKAKTIKKSKKNYILAKAILKYAGK